MTGRKIYRLTAAVLAAVSFLSACGARGRFLPGELKKASPESMSMNPSRLALIDSTVNAAVAEGLIPGAVVVVVKEDKLVYIKPFGNKSVVPDTVAMNAPLIRRDRIRFGIVQQMRRHHIVIHAADRTGKS